VGMRGRIKASMMTVVHRQRGMPGQSSTHSGLGLVGGPADAAMPGAAAARGAKPASPMPGRLTGRPDTGCSGQARGGGTGPAANKQATHMSDHGRGDALCRSSRSSHGTARSCR
jgi:hypothetical protein